MVEIVLSKNSKIINTAFHGIKFLVESEPVTFLNCSFLDCTFEPGIEHKDSLIASCFFDKSDPRLPTRVGGSISDAVKKIWTTENS